MRLTYGFVGFVWRGERSGEFEGSARTSNMRMELKHKRKEREMIENIIGVVLPYDGD